MTDQITWELVDATAEKLGVTKFARDKWKIRNTGVPHEWQIKIFEELRARGIPIAFADFEQFKAPQKASA